VNSSNFVFLNNIKPYNIFREYSSGTWFVYRESYEDMGTPNTLRILILDTNLGNPKIIMNKVVPILY